jgi:hypothetical protein
MALIHTRGLCYQFNPRFIRVNLRLNAYGSRVRLLFFFVSQVLFVVKSERRLRIAVMFKFMTR